MKQTDQKAQAGVIELSDRDCEKVAGAASGLKVYKIHGSTYTCGDKPGGGRQCTRQAVG